MTTQLSNDQAKAIQNLYSQSDKFRNLVNGFVKDEADRALKQAELLKSFGSAGAAQPVQSAAKRKVKTGTTSSNKSVKPRGRPKGSKNKKNTDVEQSNNVPSAVEEPSKTTHIDAVSQVLAGNGKKNPMSSGEILEALKKVEFPNYNVPTSATLLTVLHGMKTKNIIKSNGTRPNLRYILAS